MQSKNSLESALRHGAETSAAEPNYRRNFSHEQGYKNLRCVRCAPVCGRHRHVSAGKREAANRL